MSSESELPQVPRLTLCLLPLPWLYPRYARTPTHTVTHCCCQVSWKGHLPYYFLLNVSHDQWIVVLSFPSPLSPSSLFSPSLPFLPPLPSPSPSSPPLPPLFPFSFTHSSPSLLPSQAGEVQGHGLPQQSPQTLRGSLQDRGMCECIRKENTFSLLWLVLNASQNPAAYSCLVYFI